VVGLAPCLGGGLALVLGTELRNGMQLVGVIGATQDLVIGLLLLAAILVGNGVRAARGRQAPWRPILLSRKGVVQVNGVPAAAKSDSD